MLNSLQSSWLHALELAEKTERHCPVSSLSGLADRFGPDLGLDTFSVANLAKIEDTTFLHIALAKRGMEFVRQQNLLHAQVEQVLSVWWSCLTYAAIQNPSCWWDSSHRAHQLCNELMAWGIRYQPIANDDETLNRLSSLLNVLRENVKAKPAVDFIEALTPLTEFLLAAQKAIDEADRLLLNKEIHLIKTTHVHSTVSRVLRQRTIAQKITPRVLTFIDDVWRKYLSVIYLRVGIEHRDWTQALNDLDYLIWLSEEASKDDIDDALNDSIAELFRSLSKATESVRGIDQAVTDFIDWFAYWMAQRANGAYNAVGEADFGFDISLSDNTTRTFSVAAAHTHTVSDEDLMQEFRFLCRGDALNIRTIDGWQRARLADVDLAHDVYLISDCRGMRIAAMGRRELIVAFRAEKLRVLDRQVFMVQLEPELTTFVDLVYRQWREHYLAVLDATRQAEELVRLQEEEATRLEQAKERQRREEKVRQAELDVQRAQSADNVVRSLRAGAVVQLRQTDDRWRPAFLAMVSQANAQYIFVDRNGQRLVTWSMEQIRAALLDNTLQVLESGSTLDTTLTNIVKERRIMLHAQDAVGE